MKRIIGIGEIMSANNDGPEIKSNQPTESKEQGNIKQFWADR